MIPHKLQFQAFAFLMSLLMSGMVSPGLLGDDESSLLKKSPNRTFSWCYQ
jgi:hypothetical protein